MTFADAIATLSDGMAAKRETWAGYVKRTDSTTETGAYTLTFVKRDESTCDYVVAADGTITCASPIAFDVDLLAGMMATDWITGTATSFDAALTGEGVW